MLELAGVAHPAPRWRGAQIEAPTGRSLLPVLRGERASVRAPLETVGYELAGNAALFRGELKLVRNQPPVSDGRWRLYDIVRDPGETQNLAAANPEAFQQMQTAWGRYAQEDGVLPMPAGYEPRRQVTINAFLNVLWPASWPWLLGGVALVAATLLWVRRQRRGRSVAVRNDDTTRSS